MVSKRGLFLFPCFILMLGDLSKQTEAKLPALLLSPKLTYTTKVSHGITANVPPPGQLRLNRATIPTTTKPTTTSSSTINHTKIPSSTTKPTATLSITTKPTTTPSPATNAAKIPSSTTKLTATPSITTKPTTTPSITTTAAKIPSSTTKPTATPSITTKPTTTPSPTTNPAKIQSSTTKPTATPSSTTKPTTTPSITTKPTTIPSTTTKPTTTPSLTTSSASTIITSTAPTNNSVTTELSGTSPKAASLPSNAALLYPTVAFNADDGTCPFGYIADMTINACTHVCENKECQNGGQCYAEVDVDNGTVAMCRCHETSNKIYKGDSCETSKLSRGRERAITLGILLPFDVLFLLIIIASCYKLKHRGNRFQAAQKSYDVNNL